MVKNAEDKDVITKTQGSDPLNDIRRDPYSYAIVRFVYEKSDIISINSKTLFKCMVITSNFPKKYNILVVAYDHYAGRSKCPELGDFTSVL